MSQTTLKPTENRTRIAAPGGTSTHTRTYRGRTLEELLPRIRQELGPEAVITRQREGLMGGIGGFFQKQFVEVEARPGEAPGHRIDVYDDGGGGEVVVPDPVSDPWAHALHDRDRDAVDDDLDADDLDADDLEPDDPAAGRAAGSAAPASVAAAVAEPATGEDDGFHELAVPAAPAFAAGDAPHPGASFSEVLHDARRGVRGAAASERGAAETAPAARHAAAVPPSGAAGVAQAVAPAPPGVAGAYRDPAMQRVDAASPRASAAAPGTGIAAPGLDGAGMPDASEADERSALTLFADAAPPSAPAAAAPGPAEAAPAQDAEPPVGSVGPARTRPTAAATCEQRLLERGLDPELAAEAVAEAVTYGLPFGTPRQLKRMVRAALARRLPASPPRATGGRTIALVGPGGAGKTLTVARLAAAYARGGDRPVACLALRPRDGGAGLATLLAPAGVPVLVAATAAEARERLDRLGEETLVLIDTPSVAARASEDARALARELRRLSVDERQLALPATASGPAARELLAGLAPLRPTAIVLTHVDETDYLGGVVALTAETRLPIAAIARGTALDEGLTPADAVDVAALVLP